MSSVRPHFSANSENKKQTLVNILKFLFKVSYICFFQQFLQLGLVAYRFTKQRYIFFKFYTFYVGYAYITSQLIITLLKLHYNQT